MKSYMITNIWALWLVIPLLLESGGGNTVISYRNDQQFVQEIRNAKQSSYLFILLPDCDYVDSLGCSTLKVIPDEFSELSHLQGLGLYNSNSIQGLEKLELLKDLRYLDLSYSYNLDVDALKKLTQVDSLILEDCDIRDSHFLLDMKHLKYVCLSENPILDLDVVKAALPNCNVVE
jgi:Leucine-rich repeat (LRR) protein